VIVSSGPEPVTVPDLTGDTVDEARSTLEDQGLSLVVSSQTVDVSASSGLVGNVADQNPDSGTTVESGSDVEVFLGAIRQVTVPDVRNDTVADADAAIRAVGLLPNITDSTTTNDPDLNGRIADQDPIGGVTVDEGSTVNLNVFVFEEPDVAVPDFTNMTVADAQTLATSEGLGTVIDTGTVETSDPALDGTIESQDPAAGTTVPPETDIDVVVRVFVPPPTTTSP
jgi:serine/threonine-protein kinase